MKPMYYPNWSPFSNVLYIGDEAKVCIGLIEKFNNCLQQIEQVYSGWFNERNSKNRLYPHDKLQHHIQYHFEGGIAVFKIQGCQ